jgi:hypothetical protein
MAFKNAAFLAVTTIMLNLSILGDANAARIDVSCELRNATTSVVDTHGSGSGSGRGGLDDTAGGSSGSGPRSKITVKGYGLPKGKYYAKVDSGGNFMKSNAKAAVSRQVQFEFDSNPEDVALEGKTAIHPAFIQGGVVKASIRDAKSKLLIKTYMTADCSIR